MLYHLFDYLYLNYDVPGSGLFRYISFRSALAFIVSLIISTIYGKKIIRILRNKQVGETVRDLGLNGQLEKSGTPTMGGIIIIISTLIPVLLFTNLSNIYIILLVITTLWMGAIGFMDDYIKVFKKNKQGLKGKFKIIGQVSLGFFVGLMFYFHPQITTKEENKSAQTEITTDNNNPVFHEATKSNKTTIPFFKNNELDYTKIATSLGLNSSYAWLLVIPVFIFIITAVSNGANLTDGIDGLLAGSSAIIVLTLGIFSWISGNIIFAAYLDVMYIPQSGEMTIFIAAFVGALIGFLWYNTYPAQVFMGDTGSLAIGAIVAVLAIAVRKELLIPVLAGVFLIESFSVILQVGYFKFTRKKYGVGKRIFKMAPLHHHFQKIGYQESKIVTRFWIIGILLAVLTIVTLKIR